MRIEVNGVRIFFDVEGAKFVPDGPVMRDRPTLILLHGGPGMDHAHYMPAFSQYADIAQIIYIDHRGNGRSDRGSRDDWNVPQWGDDIHAFCQALEIEKPIVLGTSFGGIVAISYATRHPEHPGKLILASTEARAERERTLAVFERLGGAKARDVAGRFLDGDTAAFAEFGRVCSPLYFRRHVADLEVYGRSIANEDVVTHYFQPGGEASTIDMLEAMSRILCPTLILTGEDDPITPAENSADMAARIPPHLVRLERYANTGHSVFEDEPRSFDAVREFILS